MTPHALSKDQYNGQRGTIVCSGEDGMWGVVLADVTLASKACCCCTGCICTSLYSQKNLCFSSAQDDKSISCINCASMHPTFAGHSIYFYAGIFARIKRQNSPHAEAQAASVIHMRERVDIA